MISARLSRVSAVFLFVVGMALLFASDMILPEIVPSFPPGAAWIGQLLAASLLALGALNWLSRSALLGGIYGRPIVLANFALYFIGSMVLLRLVMEEEMHTGVWFVAVPFMIFAVTYGWLLLRGPTLRDFELNRGGSAAAD